jgi:cobalt-zinc-cadmium efflux system protein
MAHHHHHHHHSHAHSHAEEGGEGRLILSILLNLLITVVEVIGGLLSGSLALLSDALHNLSDTTSLAVSWATVRISRRPADVRRTFGYRRAQIIGAFVNLITLVVIALFLVSEAVERYLNPEPIDGLVMLSVALVGLAANLLTAVLLYRQSRHSLNIRSAFIHIVSDAVSSVGVVVGGVLILLYDLYLVDTLLTILISAYILVQSYQLLRQTTRILMQSVPEGMELERIVAEIVRVEGVEGVHHIHVWQLDEATTNLEAHVLIEEANLEAMPRIKSEIKARLRQQFAIAHSTLEFEVGHCGDEEAACYEVSPEQPEPERKPGR